MRLNCTAWVRPSHPNWCHPTLRVPRSVLRPSVSQPPALHSLLLTLPYGFGVACWRVPLASSTRSRATAAHNGTAAPRHAVYWHRLVQATAGAALHCVGARALHGARRVGSAQTRKAPVFVSTTKPPAMLLLQHATKQQVDVRGLRCERPRSANHTLALCSSIMTMVKDEGNVGTTQSCNGCDTSTGHVALVLGFVSPSKVASSPWTQVARPELEPTLYTPAPIGYTLHGVTLLLPPPALPLLVPPTLRSVH